MLNTIDNPYNPFEQFTSWLLFDDKKGYNTCGRIARIAKVSNEMSQKEEEDEIERAIDEIIYNDPLNLYIKVTKENINKVINKEIYNEMLNTDTSDEK
jgi:uncharacterized protein YpuA (DUF1002 family)